MNLSHIPTPETDLFYSSFADGIATPSQAEWLYRMQDLERRLAIAREALKIVHADSSSTRLVRVASEALIATAPKP